MAGEYERDLKGCLIKGQSGSLLLQSNEVKI